MYTGINLVRPRPSAMLFSDSLSFEEIQTLDEMYKYHPLLPRIRAHARLSSHNGFELSHIASFRMFDIAINASNTFSQITYYLNNHRQITLINLFWQNNSH